MCRLKHTSTAAVETPRIDARFSTPVCNEDNTDCECVKRSLQHTATNCLAWFMCDVTDSYRNPR